MEFLKSSLWGTLVLYLRLEQKNQLVMVRLGRDVLEVCGVSQSHHDEAGDGKYDKNKSSCGDASRYEW